MAREALTEDLIRGMCHRFNAGGCSPLWSPLDGCVRIPSEIDMPSEYIPVLIFAVLAASFPVVALVVFRLIRPTPVAVGAKLKPYECGVEPEGDTRGRYSVRF